MAQPGTDDPHLKQEHTRGRGPLGASRMSSLAETYPELRAFTPDATLNEIKVRYGLGTLEQVREAARRRLHRR